MGGGRTDMWALRLSNNNSEPGTLTGGTPTWMSGRASSAVTLGGHRRGGLTVVTRREDV